MNKHKATILFIAVLLAALAHRSDGQQRATVEQQLRIAALMPKGASVYVQTRDLSAVMRRWLASSQRAKFYKSASYKAFTRSRIYLKLADRIKDFEGAIGVGLDESRLTELAGGASAVAVYDIGNTELVLATELPRERAIVTALFKQAPKLQERTAEGENYYVAEVTTDAGRLKQQFCFAHVAGKLIVTTTEGLMLRVLRNLKQPQAADSLLPDVLATANQATGFGAGDLTLWLDQARLNETLYFRSYWIHDNTPQLSWMQTGIASLTFGVDAMREQRWFSAGAGAPPAGRGNAVTADTANGMLGIVPADAQLVRLYSDSTGSKLGAAAERTLLGTLRAVAPTGEAVPDQTSSSGTGSLRRERYSRLDSRFDRDVDDEVPDARAAEAAGTQDTGLAKTLTGLLEPVSGGVFCEAARSRIDSERLFVEFDRAFVVLLKENSTLDRAALEGAILRELRARFAVAGVDPRLEWREDAGVRYVSQPLVRQNAAYAVSGRYLVLGSTREFVADVLKRTAAPAPRIVDGPTNYVALVRLAASKPVFDRLMGVLDGKVANTASSDDEEREIKFFSENLSSLVDALAVREMRVKQTREASGLREEVWYGW
jgi:hypothetical protein